MKRYDIADGMTGPAQKPALGCLSCCCTDGPRALRAAIAALMTAVCPRGRIVVQTMRGRDAGGGPSFECAEVWCGEHRHEPGVGLTVREALCDLRNELETEHDTAR
jgi:hypothetical protein